MARPIINIISHLSFSNSAEVKKLKIRLGENVEQLPTIEAGGIWIHALSAGEVLSALPLARLLISIRHKIGSSKPIVMSASTVSGYKILKSSNLELDNILTMPLDAPWIMKKLVKRLRPSIFILIEGDVWPNLLVALRTHQTKCFLVNARMSPSSFQRYRLLAKSGGNTFSMFDAVFVASPEMLKFYGEFVSPSKLFFLGNIKLDAVREKKISEEKLVELKNEIGIDSQVPVWIAGSVHRGEEEVVLKTHRKILEYIPKAVLILAPRNIPGDIEWFGNASHKYGFNVARRSAKEKIKTQDTVYLVDTLGELMNFYGIAHVAFVGGSLVPKGGHNLLEPAIYGIPVCWGPYVFNFRDIAEIIKNYGRGMEIRDHKSLEDFLLRHLSKRFSLPLNSSFTYPFKATITDEEMTFSPYGDFPTIEVLSKILDIASE